MKKFHAFLISAVAILYCFIGQPFVFSDILLGGRQFSIKLALLVLLIILGSSSTVFSKKYIHIWILTVLFGLLSAAFHPDCYSGAIAFLFDATFFYCIFSLAYHVPVFRDTLYKIDVYLSIVMATSILICYFVFQYAPGLFRSMDAGDYPVYYNAFLGTVSAWGGRVVGYFNEPSYTGFYLGIHFFLIVGCALIKWWWKLLILALFIADFLVVLSLGAFIYMVAGLLILVANKVFHINTQLLKISIYASICFAIFILPNFDFYNVNQDIVDVGSTSADDRQYRMDLGNKEAKDMSIIDCFVGKGIDSVARKYKTGLSDAFRKIFVEYGLVFFVFFLWFINKTIGKNLPGYSFFLFSCFSIIVVLTPIALLTILSYYSQYRISILYNENTSVPYKISGRRNRSDGLCIVK